MFVVPLTTALKDCVALVCTDALAGEIDTDTEVGVVVVPVPTKVAIAAVQVVLALRPNELANEPVTVVRPVSVADREPY